MLFLVVTEKQHGKTLEGCMPLDEANVKTGGTIPGGTDSLQQ
jgi:hypothetical protein